MRETVETTCRHLRRADVDNRAAFTEWVETRGSTNAARPALDELVRWMRGRRSRFIN
jgi:hypothetical protein